MTNLVRCYCAVLYPRALYTVKTDADNIFGDDALSLKANIGLDLDRDGKVTPRDLRAALAGAATRPRYLELAQRVRDRQPAQPKAAPVITLPTPAPAVPVQQPVPAVVVPIRPIITAPTLPPHVPSSTPAATGIIVALATGASALWALLAHSC